MNDIRKILAVVVVITMACASIIIVSPNNTVTAVDVMDTDIDTTLTVNAAFPHMWAVEMWEQSDVVETSTLDTQVDVDNTYTFYTIVNYTIGGVDQLFDGANNTLVNLTAWYDDGAELIAPPAEDDVHRTRMFTASLYENTALTAAGATAAIYYPTGSPGTDEVTLANFSCIGPIGADFRYEVWINVTLGKQMRAAAGVGTPTGDNTTTLGTFNDADSWNFQMQIHDIQYPEAKNTTYGEFGLYRFTNITVANNPSANALPGTVSTALLPGSQVTYSSNTPYYVNVSIPDLLSGGNSIVATEVNISLAGAYPAGFNYNPYTEINASWGTFGRPMAGAGLERGVWGNWTATPMLSALDNGTISHGPWGSDFNAFGNTQVNWWVNVPAATPEGIYTATITFKIGYY